MTSLTLPAPTVPSAVPWTAIGGAAFVVGLFVKIVGFELPTTRLATMVETADGSRAPMLLFAVATVLLLAVFWARKGVRIPNPDMPLFALLGWCALSLTWSAYTATGGFRLLQVVAIPVFVLLAIEALGVRRVLSLTAVVLAAAVVLDYAYVVAWPGAVHLSNEMDSALVGNWRGVHTHKNVAGAVLAITVLFGFRAWLCERKSRYLLLVTAAVFFLWMTQSKTSIALLVLVATAFGLLPSVLRNAAVSGVAAVVAATAGAIATIFLMGNLDAVWGYVTDRGAFTGRGALWDIMAAYAQGHLWAGSGFGSFWRVGVNGPSFALATGWNAMSYNGHNGYMDALVTIGLPGLILMTFALVLVPIVRGVRAIAAGRKDAAFLTAIVVFVVLQNFFETTFLNGSSQVWLLFCIASLSLLYLPKEPIR